MNTSKAKDYFSAYHEGELDAGLRQQFEQALESDVQLQAEFADFVASLNILESSRSEVIEIPVDLHDKICARIDHHIWESKQAVKPSFFESWRLTLVGGLAIVAIGATFFAMQPNKGQQTPAGIVSGTQSNISADLKFEDGKIRLVIPAGIDATVVVSDYIDSNPIQTIPLNKRALNAPIENSRMESTVLDIDLGGKAEGLTIALPGQGSEKMMSGRGNSHEYARAIAQTFRTPVIVRISDVSKEIDWNFDQIDGLKNLPASLTSTGWSLTERKDGFLILTD